jgi:hypothetical protein
MPIYHLMRRSILCLVTLFSVSTVSCSDNFKSKSGTSRFKLAQSEASQQEAFLKSSNNDLLAQLLDAGLSRREATAILSQIETEFKKANMGFWATDNNKVIAQFKLNYVVAVAAVIASRAESPAFAKMLTITQKMVSNIGGERSVDAFKAAVVQTVQIKYPALKQEFATFESISIKPAAVLTKIRELKVNVIQVNDEDAVNIGQQSQVGSISTVIANVVAESSSGTVARLKN